MAEPSKINLGCGGAWAPGWKNLDGGPAARLMWLRKLRVFNRFLPRTTLQYPPDLIVADLRRLPLPFPDDSASVIFSQYALEYLRREECDQALADCYRILQPGGLIRLSQTDVAAIIGQYRPPEVMGPTEEAVRNTATFLALASPEHTKLMVRLLRRGGVQRLFDRPSLEYCLRKAGFVDITFPAWNEGACPDLDKIAAEFSISIMKLLHAEARKPAP
jgi:predicted SAM-dependent methyltransferase